MKTIFDEKIKGKKITMTITPDWKLFEEAQIQAVRNNISVSDFLTKAITYYFDNKDEFLKTEIRIGKKTNTRISIPKEVYIKLKYQKIKENTYMGNLISKCIYFYIHYINSKKEKK